jgi:hypothetical protein
MNGTPVASRFGCPRVALAIVTSRCGQDLSGSLPECGDVGQYVESAAGLRCIDHRRGMVGVAQTNAGLDPRRDACVVGCGYREAARMRKLTRLQSGIDQIMAENVPGNDKGYHVSGAGRKQADPIETQLVILAEAIQFRRRIHCRDAGVDALRSMACDCSQLGNLLIGQKVHCVLAGAPAARLEINISACIVHRRSTHPGRKLAGHRFFAVADLVDQENATVRRRPLQAARVRSLLGEGTIRAARALDAELVVESGGTIDLDVDRRSGPGICVDAGLDRNVCAGPENGGREIACQQRSPKLDSVGQIPKLYLHLLVQEGLVIAER